PAVVPVAEGCGGGLDALNIGQADSTRRINTGVRHQRTEPIMERAHYTGPEGHGCYRRYEISPLQPAHRLLVVVPFEGSHVSDETEQVSGHTEDGCQASDVLNIAEAQGAIFDLAHPT